VFPRYVGRRWASLGVPVCDVCIERRGVAQHVAGEEGLRLERYFSCHVYGL